MRQAPHRTRAPRPARGSGTRQAPLSGNATKRAPAHPEPKRGSPRGALDPGDVPGTGVRFVTTDPKAAPAERPSFVVIGTSTGGVEALQQIFKDLPPGFPGALLVVLHVAKNARLGWLAKQLGRAGLPVQVARDEAPIVQGVAYLAPADTHLLVEEGRLRLGRGPSE